MHWNASFYVWLISQSFAETFISFLFRSRVFFKKRKNACYLLYFTAHSIKTWTVICLKLASNFISYCMGIVEDLQSKIRFQLSYSNCIFCPNVFCHDWSRDEAWVSGVLHYGQSFLLIINLLLIGLEARIMCIGW